MTFDSFSSSIAYLGTSDRGKVARAFEVAKKAHEGQLRKSGEPYFLHPIATAKTLAKMGADAETIIAALLHDSVEDTPLTIQDIHDQFGSTVGTLIDGVTKLCARDLQDQPGLDEQLETLRKMFQLMQSDVRIMVIKLADRLHNMQTIGFLSKEKQERIARETMDVYVKIADRLCMQDLRDELEGLALQVLDPALFQKLSKQRKKNKLQGVVVLDDMKEALAKGPAILVEGTELLYEDYSWGHLKSQVEKGGSAVTGIASVAIAFIAPSIDACYSTMGTLHRHWQREFMSFQDHINTPIINGYQGLHTTIILPDGARVRCKIRTKEMHAYARRGIAAVCFQQNNEASSLYLPWTLRIAPLAEGTKDRSKDFWENLQSDILGESIVVHSKNDASVLIPHGSTALDGAFFLFKEQALYCKDITVDGKSVPFQERLTHAATLDITLAKHEIVDRNWLAFVRTGSAAAEIRRALKLQSEEKKITIGKSLLQDVMTQQKYGLIDEFDELDLQKKFSSIGVASLKEIYIAIAEGRLEPEHIAHALFTTRQKLADHRQHAYRVSYNIDMNNIGLMDQVNQVHRKFGDSLEDIQYHRQHNAHDAVILKAKLSFEQLNNLFRELTIAGIDPVTIKTKSHKNILLLGIVILLWGLDPVFARFILSEYISPIDLTIIRFITFFLAATVTHTWFLWSRGRGMFKSLLLLKPSLLLSSLALFLTGLFSYLTLQEVPATQYITFIIGGLTCATLFQQALSRHVQRNTLISLIALVLASATLMSAQGFTTASTLTAIGSALSFAAYSKLSKFYQEKEAKIHARYPAFVFWLSVLILPMVLVLLPLDPSLLLVHHHGLAYAVIFSLIFCFLPYALYFECMRRTDEKILDQLIPLACIVALIGETAMTRSFSAFLALPFLLIFFWSHTRQHPSR